MSEKFKLKYEVAAILRDNIVKGLTSFGVQIANSPGEPGWVVMESDQPAFRNADYAVLFFLEHSERIGWQGQKDVYNHETDKFDEIEYFIDQQTWKIRVISKRTTKEITAETIPIMPSDVVEMLRAWFNRKGCIEFRKHHMANLFIQTKDVQTYKDKSDVNQWMAEFPLKLQVIKEFKTEVEWASVRYAGAIGIQGEAKRKIVDISEIGKFIPDSSKIRSSIGNWFYSPLRRIKDLLFGISQDNPRGALT